MAVGRQGQGGKLVRHDQEDVRLALAQCAVLASAMAQGRRKLRIAPRRSISTNMPELATRICSAVPSTRRNSQDCSGSRMDGTRITPGWVRYRARSRKSAAFTVA